jgi:hypothetical protein
VKSATRAGQDLVDRAFELPTGGLADIVVTLTNRVSVLSGIARDASGAAAPSATVIAFPADRSLWASAAMASGRTQAAAPSRTGRYELRGLPPGEYWVAAVEAFDADVSDAVFVSLAQSASRVTIGEGTTHSLDLRVVTRR